MTNSREPTGRLGVIKMRVRYSRRQRSTVLTIVGVCLGVYVLLAVAFHWFAEPTLAKSREAEASKPPQATAAGYPAAAFVAYAAPSTEPSRVALMPPVVRRARAPASAAVAAVDREPVAVERPKKAAKKQTPPTVFRREQSARSFVTSLFSNRSREPVRSQRFGRAVLVAR
jgi:hypothetical protein